MSSNWGVAVAFDDAGGKEGVAIGGDDEAEIHEAADEEFEVFEAFEDVCEGDSTFSGGATLIFFEASFDVGAFVFFQPS